MKVIIAGSRIIRSYNLIKTCMNDVLTKTTITEVVSGGAEGVDKLGEQWAKENGIPIKLFLADWDNLDAPNAIIKHQKGTGKAYNAKAGTDRNIEMAKYADACVVIHNNTAGSIHMVKTAMELDLDLYEFRISRG